MKILVTLFWVSLGMIILTSCYDDSLDATATVSENDLNYLDTNTGLQGLVNNPFTIIGITPVDKGQVWKLVVEYAGGCETHKFTTYTPSEESDNTFFIYHNGQEDLCKALVRDTIELEMNLVLPSTRNLSSGSINVINASNNRTISIDSEIAQISQSMTCQLNTTLSRSTCDLGVWSDRWLLLNKPHSDGSDIWLHPVANSLDVALDQPDLGECKVGVTLLLGNTDFQSACSEIPNGHLVSVAINCKQKL